VGTPSLFLDIVPIACLKRLENGIWNVLKDKKNEIKLKWKRKEKTNLIHSCFVSSSIRMAPMCKIFSILDKGKLRWYPLGHWMFGIKYLTMNKRRYEKYKSSEPRHKAHCLQGGITLWGKMRITNSDQSHNPINTTKLRPG
jgi:hypothetical protein